MTTDPKANDSAPRAGLSLPRFVHLLRDHARFVEARCPDGATVADDMRTAADWIDRLQAIVAELNTTLDGVPLTPGTDRWSVAHHHSPDRKPYVEQVPADRPEHPWGWSTEALAVKALRAEERERGLPEDRLTPEETPKAAETAGEERA